MSKKKSSHTPINPRGQKPPLKADEVWAIRVRLELAGCPRNLALFNLAIDSKLRGCDLVSLKVSDVAHGCVPSSRAVVLQQKTGTSVHFELTGKTRQAVGAWIKAAGLKHGDYLFPSRLHDSAHLSTRQYARIVKQWVSLIGLDPTDYGTHSLRRTKVTIMYRKNPNLRTIQLLLGHKKIESTVRYLGVEIDDALEMAENTEV